MSPNPEWDNYTPELRLAREISDARDALARENDRLKAERDRAVGLLRELSVDGFTVRPEFWQAVKDARAFLKEVDSA